MGDGIILQSGPVLGLGNHTFANPPSYLSAPLPLDVDLMTQIEVFIVYTERLVCTWYVPKMHTLCSQPYHAWQMETLEPSTNIFLAAMQDKYNKLQVHLRHLTFQSSVKAWWGRNTENSAKGNLLSYYLANKQSLHVRSQGLEILTLIEEK